MESDGDIKVQDKSEEKAKQEQDNEKKLKV